MRKRPLIWAAAAVLVTAGGAFFAIRRADRRADRAAPGQIPLAVLGDSDSHSYRDTLAGIRRGGDYHAVTYQWTEILAALRPRSIDQGPMEAFGTRYRFAAAKSLLGMATKTPRKEDFRYNYSVSGLGADSLREAWPKQAKWLTAELNQRPNFWRNGVVVIRIGINDVGQEEKLLQYARQGIDEAARDAIRACTDRISNAALAVTSAHDSVRVVLVGIADNSLFAAPESEIFHVPEGAARIHAALDLFDSRLKETAAAHPRVVFMNDRAWIERYRDATSQTGGILFADRFQVSFTRGDHPKNAALSDGHAGTIINGLWARELIRLLNRETAAEIPEIRDEEIARLADPSGVFGISPLSHTEAENTQ